MGKIIGEPFKKYLSKQINQRQLTHGSGTNLQERDQKTLTYLNSKTSFLKLASGIHIDSQRVQDEGINEGYTGNTLAKRFVLFNGISDLYSGEDSQTLIQRGTTLDGNANIWDIHNGIYNVSPLSSGTTPISEFGLNPMPGVTSAEIKSLNRGSIKRATINIKCYTPEQFKIIDLLYLRIGYTVFLEWGNSIYLNNSGDMENMGYTLIEDDSDNGFFSNKWKSSSYLGFLPIIEGYRKDKFGNYDGLLAKVSNFNWTFSQDGSYDIELQLISLGDVIESLKVNVTPPQNITTFIKDAYQIYTQETTEQQDLSIPHSPEKDIISSYLFLQKLYLTKNLPSSGYQSAIDFAAGSDGSIFGLTPSINLQNITINIANQVNCTIDEVPIPGLKGIFIQPSPGGVTVEPESKTTQNFQTKELAEEWVQNNLQGYNEVGYYTTFTLGDKEYLYKLMSDFSYVVIYQPPKQNLNIETNQSKTDVLYMNYINDDDITGIKDSGFYMRLGHLFEFLNQYAIPTIKDTNNTPIINLNSGPWDNIMYTVPYQVSFDPRVCLVNGGENVSRKNFFPQLDPWKNSKLGYAWTMNIYVSHDQILNSLSYDDEGNVSLFDFLSNICTALNKALGGVNNLEPVIDEDTNTINIIDSSYSMLSKDKDYILELFGYNGITSNFVRNFTLKTEITNDFATMATIGSTAGGYVKGVENTMFSKWNRGLTDLWKEKYIIPQPANQTEDPATQYANEFWEKYYSPFGYTINENGASLDGELIDKNISIVTEFYKYLQSKAYEKNPKYSSPTNGFIPINLGVTLDGIAGIKIYNSVNVDTRFLPSNYPDNLNFIIKGVTHKLMDSDWETNFETVVISRNEDSSDVTYPFLKSTMDEVLKDKVSPIADWTSNLLSTVAGFPIGNNKKDNIRIIASYLKSIGLTKEGTIGLIGNILGESQANPKASEKNPKIGGIGGIGIVQWTGNRRRKLEAASGNNINTILDLNFQLKYIGTELTSSYKSTYKKLSTTKSIPEATIFVLEHYEITDTYLNRVKNPSAYELTKTQRINYANSVISIVEEIYK